MGFIPEKTELLYGFVFSKMPKSPLHSFIAEMLADMLRALLGLGYFVRVEQPITCDISEPEPDVAVVKGKREDYRHAHPRTAELVIEVAMTTEAHDRSKAAAYASAGIPEFWILLVSRQQIEIHSDPQHGAYTTVRIIEASGRAESCSVPGFGVTPGSLFGKS